MQNKRGIFKTTPVDFESRALKKIYKHCTLVYPLEGYGFLIGTREPEFIKAALPVGKTARWYEYLDRFANIMPASEKARHLASKFDMEVLGLYHSYDSDCTKELPLKAVPLEYRNSFIYVQHVNGGYVYFKSYGYRRNAEGIWEQHEVRRRVQRITKAEQNPKRIMTQWNRIWGVLDYGNNHKEELRRLFGNKEA